MSTENMNMHTAPGLYERLSAWNNRVYALLLRGLAVALGRLAALLRDKSRASLEEQANFLRKLARYIVLPETVRQMASPQLLKSALLETLGFTVFLTLVTTWTLVSVYGLLVIDVLAVVVLVVVLCLIFTHLLYLLALSSDVYQKQRDEAQRLCAYQASATALRWLFFLSGALCLCVAFMPGWRTWIALDLGALLLFIRMLYLARLAQLRWSMFHLMLLDEEAEQVGDSR